MPHLQVLLMIRCYIPKFKHSVFQASPSLGLQLCANHNLLLPSIYLGNWVYFQLHVSKI